MERRQFLKLGSAVAGAGVLSGCQSISWTDDERSTDRDPTETRRPETETNTPPTTDKITDGPTTRHGITFENVLHAVDDLGMDPEGNEPIDAALDKAHGDDTLVVFPPGNYLARKEHHYETPTKRFGLLGLGESRNDVQFVFPKGNKGAPDPSDYIFFHIENKNARDYLFENLTFQQTNDMVTGVGTKFRVKDGLRLVDIEFAGFSPNTNLHGPSYSVIAHIADRSGVGVIRRFVSVDGGVVSEYPHRKTPIGVFHNHQGELRIEDAHIEESGSHSMYASRSRGCVRVEGGVFRNNANTNLRLSGGGHPKKRSWIKGAKVEIDLEKAKHLRDGQQYNGLRGIWVESGGAYNYGYSDLLIEDVEVVARSNRNAQNLPLLLVDFSHGSVTVRNCRFHSELEEVQPVDIRQPDRKMIDGDVGVTLENVEVTTTAKRVIDNSAIQFESRPGSTVKNSKVNLSIGWVDGILASNSNGLTIVDTDIRTKLRPDMPELNLDDINAFNNGIVIRNSKDCRIENVNIEVPNNPTKYIESNVTEKQVFVG